MAVKKQLKKSVAQKVNKAAQPAEITPVVVSDEEYRCSCCGHKYKRQKDNFNVSKSPIYKGNNGYLTICKRCVSELFEQYVKFFDGDEDAAMERICQITDMYVDDVAWGASRKVSSDRSRISAYVAKLNLNQSKGTTYADTLIKRWEVEEAAEAEAAKTPDQRTEDEGGVSMDVVRRFGTGFSDDDYDSLEYEYQNWVERYGVPIDKRQEELYISICYMKLNLQKMLQKGDANIGAASNNYKSQIEAATIEIEDRKRKAESDMELKPLGILYRDIEEYCPAEYYKDKKLYMDYDHLKEYISRFMIRPLHNLLLGTKEKDKEFNLSGSEE